MGIAKHQKKGNIINLNWQDKNYVFDAKATKQLILKFTRQPKIKKIFIEPHLKQRLGLQKESKIRFP